MVNFFSSAASLLLVGLKASTNNVFAFTPSTPAFVTPSSTTEGRTFVSPLSAGGFEWEDPAEAFDQDVENPFKNPEIAKEGDESEHLEDMKIDPARLLGPRLQGSNLYLIGMMGSGKSVIGDSIARRMGTYNFLDTDSIIEKATNMTIPQIFEAEGEEPFRKIESQILDSVHAYVRCVISTGGGIVCKMQNWSKLQTGIVVYIDVSPEVLLERIGKDPNRPLLQTDNPLETLEKLLEERRKRYEQADIKIEVDGNMDETEVSDLIVKELHNFIDENPPAWKMAKAKAQAEGLDWVQ